MSEYKPGTVAKATVRGQEDVLVVRTHGGAWVAPITVDGWTFHGDSDVTDVRPLILLDPTLINGSARNLVEMLRIRASSPTSPLTLLADQIEAQTKPPRIPEPGLWGVVEAWTDGIPTRRWVHHEEDRWVCDTGERRNWEALSDPTLVREGVES